MKRGRFPQRIKCGSFVVTIYRTPNKGYSLFTVAHYDANGKFCRRTFADFEQARNAAEETAKNFAGGTSDSHLLTGEELMIYRRATEALKCVGVSMDVAAIQFARSVVNGANAIGNGTAKSLESATLPPGVNALLVAEVLDELLASKKAKGRSPLYLTDLRVRLTRFAKAFNRPLGEITSTDIDRFLDSLGISARSQNNFRASIGTLFRFGQAKGHVGRDHPGVSQVDKASQSAQEVQVFAPDEIEKLLRAAKEELLPAIAIGAFAGIRSEELKRLSWEDIHLKEGHIEIRSAKSKTKVRRLIPIPKNLKAWLLPCFQKEGAVVPFSNLALQFAKLAQQAGVKWKKNGLRHSFISYRTAVTNNLAMVSLEAGNSPAVISRSYLKCVSPGDARRWFGIFPDKIHLWPDESQPRPTPTNAEQWANTGRRRMRKESRSPAGIPNQEDRSAADLRK